MKRPFVNIHVFNRSKTGSIIDKLDGVAVMAAAMSQIELS